MTLNDHNPDFEVTSLFAIARNVCLLARLLKNACMDFDDILHVHRCRDMDEPIRIIFWIAGTGLLSPIVYALQHGILLRRENPTYWYWVPIEAATRGLRRQNTVVRGKCALPGAFLVWCWISQKRYEVETQLQWNTNTYTCCIERYHFEWPWVT